MTGILPADLANQALDAIGHGVTIGDLQEGSIEAKAALRAYGPVLRDVLRGVHWNFARRQSALTLLQDITGLSASPVGTGTVGMRPWIYEYQWPIDGLKARFVPATMYPGAATSPPIMTGLQATPWAFQRPAPFVVGSDVNTANPGVPGSWAGYPEPAQGQGGPTQTVILTNQPNATLVYTALVTNPEEWDPSFRQAFVAVFASFLAMPVLPDKKMAMQVRAQQVAAAKRALDAARVTDGNEGFTSVNREASWMRARNSGYGSGWNGWGNFGGWGDCYIGYGSVGMGDGSAY